MAGPLPPSSPAAPGLEASYDEQVYHQPFSEENYDISLNEEYRKGSVGSPFCSKGHYMQANSLQLETRHKRQHQYPTPQASSSTGRSSSPIRAVPVDSPPACAITELAEPAPIVGHRQINIELDPHANSRLAVGRKKSVCDIVLPSKKNISRQHAFISYTPVKNQVKLECNGTNGIVVVLPRESQCSLIKKDPKQDVYELCENISEDNCATHNKKLERGHQISSFVLLKGEIVIMPLVVGTIVDFRQAEAVLTLKQMESVSDKDESLTETESEIEALLTKSDDFHVGSTTPEKFLEVAVSPSTLKVADKANTNSSPCPVTFSRASEQYASSFTEQVPILARKATPLRPIEIKQPFTPKKRKMEAGVQTQSTPVPKVSKRSTNCNTLRSANLPDAQQHSENGGKKRRQHKPHSDVMKPAKDPLSSLRERNIDCVELQHVLANHLAFANVQQTPLSQLQEVNSKMSAISREELRALLAQEACIGIIYREGKDAAGKPLDEEYYYDVENDPDTERRNLVTALKGGRSGLRSCRRTHKQYFWKKPAK